MSADDVDPYDLVAVSARNRADPLGLFRSFLRQFWQDNWPEEALELWRRQVAGGRWYAEDVLYALKAVQAAPPADLGAILSDDGWVNLGDQDPEAWLADTIQRFEAVLTEGA